MNDLFIFIANNWQELSPFSLAIGFILGVACGLWYERKQHPATQIYANCFLVSETTGETLAQTTPLLFIKDSKVVGVFCPHRRNKKLCCINSAKCIMFSRIF